MARARKSDPKSSSEQSTVKADGPDPEADRAEPAGDSAELAEAERVAEPPEPVAVGEDPAEAVAEALPGPASDPEPLEKSVSTQDVTVIERKGGFVPMVLGGLLAGGIGFGAAAYVLPRYFSSPGIADAVAALDSDLKAQAEKIAGLGGSIDDLRGQQAEQSANSASAEALAAQVGEFGTKLDSLSQSVTDLEGRLSAFDARLTKAEQRPVTGDAASAAALSAFQSEMEGFRAEIAAQTLAVEAAKNDVAAAASAATTRIDTLRTDAEKIRTDAETTARKAVIVAAVGQLEAALDSGAALSDPIAELSAAGIDVPAALGDQAQGVPTLTALRDSFPDAARKALALSVKEEAGPDAWSRFVAFFRSQSGARSLAPRAGDDPDAVLSRAESNVRAGDLAGAVAELKALPDAGQAAMSEWLARADHRLQAVEAAMTIKQQAE